ncbi:MAG: hypothetical protein U0R44_05965 [Candidatus Micrarchaeia archaeon]
MGSLRDRVKKNVGKPASVAPPKVGDGLVEGPVVPKAPAVPEQPAPETARSVPKPAPASEPSPARTRATPPPLPAISDEESGGARVSESELIPKSTGAPASAPKPALPAALADLDALVGDKDAAPPEPVAPPKKDSAPPEAKPEAKKKSMGWAFGKDDFPTSMKVAAEYKIIYTEATANGLKFQLNGKEKHEFELGLDESRTFDVDSSEGPLSIKVTNKGINTEGSLEVRIDVDGGKSAGTKAAEKTAAVVAKAGESVSKVWPHVPEVITASFAVGIPVVIYAVGGQPLKDALGQVWYHIVGAGTPLVMAALTAFQFVSRRKDMAEEGKTPKAEEPKKGES